jgi:biopolymer transport protein ExbB
MMGAGIVTMLTKGEPIMFLLLALSILSLALIVVKVVQLWPATSGTAARTAALALWASGDRHGAIAAMPARAPADRVMKSGMESLQSGLPPALVEGDLTRLGNEEVAAMSSGLRLLDLISMISPLLGLLGTVIGMVQSFQDLSLAEGSANASVLAGGIWLALLTTAAGLVVAIPAAIGANLLTGRVDAAALKIESAVGQLLNITARGR